uniref:Ribosomal eL28/Mak16 domain-containing protein n=1 Tax=Oryza barthii TaxID=65489 RepID=A0A0D3GAB6_9ORYZ
MGQGRLEQGPLRPTNSRANLGFMSTERIKASLHAAVPPRSHHHPHTGAQRGGAAVPSSPFDGICSFCSLSNRFYDPIRLLDQRSEMATIPEPLIWEIVKKNNCFLVKQFGNSNAKVQFTKEPNNLYNVHSYKHSGLANKKTVTIQPSGAKDAAVVLSTTKTKKQNAPAKLYHKSVMRKEFRKMAKAVKNQVSDNYYRPDLTKPALARLSSVYRSLQVSKSGAKKKNRQPTKL